MKDRISFNTRNIQYHGTTTYSEGGKNNSLADTSLEGGERKVKFYPVELSVSSRVSSVYMLQFLFLAVFLSLVLPSIGHAHRGARNEVDICRFSVGDEVVHFSAYTPTVSAGKSYCRSIPSVGLTDLVFDYEGKKLRDTTVEFEITKEPEGTRIFYQEPEKIKKGSVDAKVDFSKHGAGNYLAHVTIMYQGEKLDSHLPFSVGLESEESNIPTMVKVLFFLVIAIIAIMIWASRKKRDELS